MKCILKLYITGRTPKSDRAVANLKRICKKECGETYEIKVIDILQNPQLAAEDKIIATPTVTKELPPPIRKVVGDLSRTEKVLIGLDLICTN